MHNEVHQEIILRGKKLRRKEEKGKKEKEKRGGRRIFKNERKWTKK